MFKQRLLFWRPIIISISIQSGMDKKKKTLILDDQQQKKLLLEFLKSYEDFSIQPQDDNYRIWGRKKYLSQLQKVANLEKKILQVSLDDLQRYFQKENQKLMISKIRKNTYRYLRMLQSIAVDLLPQRNKDLNPEEQIQYKYGNFLSEQRDLNLSSAGIRRKNQNIPASTKQNFDLAIVFGSDGKVKNTPISQLRAENIGQLVSLRGIVVRTSEVRPEVQVATYVCDLCGSENYQEVMGGKYPQMLECKAIKCTQNNMRGKLTFYPGHSKFRSFQQIKIQETPEQLRRGAIPKSTYLELRGSLASSVSPGDIVKVQGILLPKKKKLNPFYEDLSFDNCISVMKIARQKKKYVELEISEQQKKTIQSVREQMDEETLFKSLANSIAPEIYGLQTVKKALLLQMAGGVTVQTSESMKIRGQINVSIFGDPGIAKSQLLKHISHISPRAVYTTGKGSSGVGLTAAIVTDPVTKELSLEAGALVLADMGVCCIDEFDKMDEYDRTAIHEVMEQQTVSITKAGIITTLNSRTAILAAANPAFGRYNKAESIQRNLNLPAALLSRFDLIFILLDQANKQKDKELACHIGRVHQRKNGPAEGIFNQAFLRAYLSLAKQYEPVIPPSLNEQIVRKYVEKRQQQKSADSQEEEYITMRSFLALIRLSQARAKLRFSQQVSMSDFLQSLQIIEQSQESVKIKTKNDNKNHSNFIFESLKSMCLYSKDRKVSREIFFNKMISKSYTSEEVRNTIHVYRELGVLTILQDQILLLEDKKDKKPNIQKS